MSNYRRRVDALERSIHPKLLEQDFERELQELWPEVERMAAEAEIDAHDLADAMREGFRRRREIGDAAYELEVAEELGMTVEQLHDPEFVRAYQEQQRREWEEWQERRAAEDAQRVTWCAGVKYIGGVPADERETA